MCMQLLPIKLTIILDFVKALTCPKICSDDIKRNILEEWKAIDANLNY